MSVDVIGANGERFHNTWWAWRPLAIYCFKVAPELCEGSQHFRRWMTNDGSMTHEEAQALSDALVAEIKSERIYQYDPYAPENIEAYGPNLTAEKVREHYAWSVANVSDFADFLANSRGFVVT